MTAVDVYHREQDAIVRDAAAATNAAFDLLDPWNLDGDDANIVTTLGLVFVDATRRAARVGEVFVRGRREEYGVQLPPVIPDDATRLARIDDAIAAAPPVVPWVKSLIGKGSKPLPAIDVVRRGTIGQVTRVAQAPARTIVAASSEDGAQRGLSRGWRRTPRPGVMPCHYCAWHVATGTVRSKRARRFHDYCGCRPVEQYDEWVPETAYEQKICALHAAAVKKYKRPDDQINYMRRAMNDTASSQKHSKSNGE